MPETWRDIPGHRVYQSPRDYQASSLGQVRSVPRTLRDGRTAGGQVLARQDDKDGYPTVKLGGRRVRVSVAVQLAFAGPPEVRHLDGDRQNCAPPNLEYGSRWRNEQDKQEARERREKGRTERIREDERSCSRPSPVGTSPVTGVTDGR